MRFIKNAILVIMSLVAASFAVLLIYGIKTESIDSETLATFFKGYIITFVAMVVYSFFTGAISLGLSISNKRKPGFAGSLITKILMIPFFLANFAFWVCLLGMFGIVSLFTAYMGGFLLGIPTIIIGCLATAGTYLIMLSTSINLIVPFIRKVFKKEANPIGIIGTIMLFIFCLDAVGVAILGLSTKRSNNNNSRQLGYQA